MKKIIQISLGLIVLLVFGCTPLLEVVQESVSQSLYQTKMDKVVKVWDAEDQKLREPDKSSDGTWLNVGLRYPYAVLKAYASLEKIEEAAGLKVFVSGPHSKNIDFNSQNSFGHYNPAFVTRTLQTLKNASANAAFKTLAQQIYDEHLKTTARGYYKAYQYVNNSPQIEGPSGTITLGEIMDTYKRSMTEEGTSAGDYIQDIFNAYSSNEEKKGLDVYVASTAPGFWTRRRIDNSDKEFFALLEYVISQYDANFK
jgi:hypothetical protein